MNIYIYLYITEKCFLSEIQSEAVDKHNCVEVPGIYAAGTTRWTASEIWDMVFYACVSHAYVWPWNSYCIATLFVPFISIFIVAEFSKEIYAIFMWKCYYLILYTCIYLKYLLFSRIFLQMCMFSIFQVISFNILFLLYIVEFLSWSKLFNQDSFSSTFHFFSFTFYLKLFLSFLFISIYFLFLVDFKS